MSTAAEQLLNGFEAGNDALAPVRRAARDRFAAMGLPTPKVEAWKFTNLRPLEKFLSAAAEPANDVAPALPEPTVANAIRLVMIDGRLEPKLSETDAIDGLEIGSVAGDPDAAALLEEALTADASPVRSLNAAMAGDGLLLRLKSGARIERPIELLFVGTGRRRNGHHAVIVLDAGSGAEATVIERHLGDGGYVATVAGVVRLEANAGLRHLKLQDESRLAFHLADSRVQLGRDARYDRCVLSVGGRLARDEVYVGLAGEGASTRLLGAYVGRGEQHLDHTTRIDHAVPHCTSHEVYKGVLDDRSRGVFQGGILVRKDAQKTDGHQMNKALLLSPKAEIDSKPALQIYADDVKCSHGATAGEIDEDQLFYMRSRGLDLAAARALLVQAFLDEVFDDLADPALRAVFTERVHAALRKEGKADG